MPRTLPAVSVALAFAFGLGPFALSAQAQVPCVPRNQALELLSERGQIPSARGLAGQAMMEMFVNPQTEDWSITVTLPDGRTCLMASGIAFSGGAALLPARGEAL